MSLLARLLLLVTVALLPSLAIQAWGERMAGAARERETEQEALRLARLAAAEHQHIIEGARQLLTALGKAPPLLASQPEACSAYFANLLQDFPRYATVSAADLSGRITCTARPNGIGQDVSDRTWFRGAVTTGRFTTGEYILGRGSARASISFSQPYGAPGGGPAGAPSGAVVAALDLEWLGGQLAAMDLPVGAVAFVLDRHGAVLARRPALPEALGQPAPESIRALLAEPREGTRWLPVFDGVPRIVAWTPVDREARGLFVGVGLDATAVLAEASRASRTGLLLLAAGALFALFVTWIGMRHLVQAPTGALLAAAERWRRGDLAARISLPRGTSAGEFGRLAQAFDAMAEAVQARERAAAESEARFRLLVDAIPQLAWSAGPDGRVDTYNRRWQEVTGLHPAPGDEGWLALVHPEDAARTRAAWRQSLATGEPFEAEHRLRDREGGWRPVLALALPLRERTPGGAPGRVLRWFGTLTDIGEVVAARDTLRRGQAELERLVAERTVALEAANRRLREETAAREAAQERLAQGQKMEALGQLAGGIAHDFNNVLQAVSGAARLISQRPEDATRSRRLAGMALEAASRGASVTRRLLAFARRDELRIEAVEAGPLLHGLREILRHTLGAGIEVRVEAPPGLPWLLADRGQLETVLVNLATNARDAMPRGGVLVLRAQEEVVGPAHPEGLAPGRYLRVEVADNGAGMDEATLGRAPEPFFTTKPKGQGTGLGLPMAKGFAEQSGGALRLASTPGEGTKVTLWLPEGQPDRGLLPSRPAAGAGEGRPPHVLLVDDEPLVRGLLADELAHRGWPVTQAAGGPEALALLDGPEGQRFDLLITDLSMPGMDGLALIREARRRRPGLPALVVTGHAHEAEALGGLPEGGGPVVLLRKPIGGAELAERARLVLAVEPAAE